jgi:hypothetical protein
MRLVSFRVEGFKNLRQPIVLDDLGPINVIHGANNIGKSNLLQAIELFFWLIGLQDDSGIPLQGLFRLSDEDLAQAGFPRTEIFNLEVPSPIQLEAEVAITPEDLERAGLTSAVVPLDRLDAALELRWMGTYVEYRIRRFKLADGRDFAVATRTMAEHGVLSALANLVSKNLRIGADPTWRFAMIGVERLNNPELALALYDAKESSEIDISRQWERFVEAIAAFKDILGEGTFVATYSRKAKQASLLFQTARARIPLHLLGSGVQQLAAVLGTLLVSGGTIAGIEEPELNLKYTLQRRLREVLANLVGVPGGMDQLFLTSHSDAFEAGPHFYLMEATPDGPRVEKRPVEGARIAIGLTTDGLPPDPNAVLSYISTEGVVRVPERIRNVLHLPQGGGVIFLARDGSVEMMSDKTFADRFEPKREEKDDEQS